MSSRMEIKEKIYFPNGTYVFIRYYSGLYTFYFNELTRLLSALADIACLVYRSSRNGFSDGSSHNEVRTISSHLFSCLNVFSTVVYIQNMYLLNISGNKDNI